MIYQYINRIKARDEEFVKILEEINPELIVVVAFGQILPKVYIRYT